MVEKFGEGSEKILELIRQNKSISAKEISLILKISDRAVEKNIAKLKSKGILKRVGPDKGGHWEIAEKERR